jgi:hypothetical protein
MDAGSRCGKAPQSGRSSGRAGSGSLYSLSRDDPLPSLDRGRLRVSQPVVPGNGGRTGNSPATPRRWRATIGGLLARLLPGQGDWAGPTEAAEFDAAARRAYESSLRLENGVPLVPARPSARHDDGPRSAQPTAPVATPAAAPPPDDGTVATPESPASTPPGAPTSEDATPNPAPAVAPTLRRRPGDTAPDFLLRAPTSVIPKADDFFDGLVRQVERNR